MKKTHIFIFCISIFFLFFGNPINAQKKDSLKIKNPYSLRLGVDISKPIIGFIDQKYTGFEISGDFQLKKNLFIASEMGYIKKTSTEDYIDFTTEGQYLKIGANYNAYKNWLDMRNEIFVGFRYGYSSFSQQLNSYTIFQKGRYFDPTTIFPNENFDNLNAHWAELVLGIKVETLKNLFLGAQVSFNTLIKTTDPDNFKNLYIPGFNNRNLNSIGAGFNYTISYQIPLYKKVN